MEKRILLSVAAIIALAIGVVGMSAFEAHVINVTAHIENALAVNTTPINFGTVFPQEYLTNAFTINLSDSFKGQTRLDDVNYNIVQKPKPKGDRDAIITFCDTPASPGNGVKIEKSAYVLCRDYIGKAYKWEEGEKECTHKSIYNDYCYLDLCPYLSKLSDKAPVANDTDAPSYYVATNAEPAHCITPGEASGELSQAAGDTTDTWTVDLKVPPVAGYVGQEWPVGCPTVALDSQDYGCDLWIEVTGFSKPECSDGLDNDGNGKIDFPADQGCDSPTDNDESTT